MKDLLIFWFNATIIIILLSSLSFCTDEQHAKSKYKYVNSNDDCYKYCELLTQEQIKVLGLEE